MTKKKRLAAAYLISFLINGVFWLAYAHELRQASANTPHGAVFSSQSAQAAGLRSVQAAPAAAAKRSPPD